MGSFRGLGGAVALLGCSLLVPSLVVAAASPRQTLDSILAAGRAQQSVHYVAASTDGVTRTRLVCDVGRTEGIQRITYVRGKTTGKVTVVVSAGTAYFRGDRVALTEYMGFKPVPSAKFAGKWIRIPHADRYYAPVAAAVTLSTTMDELRLAGPLAFLPNSTVAGQKVIGIRGTTVVKPVSRAILYARAQGTPLPVGEVDSSGGGLSEMLLSHWNEQVHVAVPTGAVAIATTGLK